MMRPTTQALDEILAAIDTISREHDPKVYGLPIGESQPHDVQEAMREAIATRIQDDRQELTVEPGDISAGILEVDEDDLLRQQLVANAPPAPAWFEPSGLPEKPGPPHWETVRVEGMDVSGSGVLETTGDFFMSPAGFRTALPEALIVRARGYRGLWAEYEDVRAAWEDLERRERIGQWPWYYAELVLAHKSETSE